MGRRYRALGLSRLSAVPDACQLECCLSRCLAMAGFGAGLTWAGAIMR